MTKLNGRFPAGDGQLCAKSIDCNGSFTPAGIEAATSGSTAYSRPSHLIGG
jgi:hypothetical protein